MEKEKIEAFEQIQRSIEKNVLEHNAIAICLDSCTSITTIANNLEIAFSLEKKIIICC